MPADDIDTITALGLFARQCGDDIDDRRWLRNARAYRCEVFVEFHRHAIAAGRVAALHFALDPAPCGTDAFGLAHRFRKRIAGLETDQLANRGLDTFGRNFFDDFFDGGIFLRRHRERWGAEDTDNKCQGKNL